jgi:DNA-binding MarR family transcriptional regulator
MSGADHSLDSQRLPRPDASPADGAYTGPPLPQKPEIQILQALRRIIRAVDIHSRELAARYGITGPQLVCLATLCDEGAMTGAELSRRVFVSASTITGIIDRLEKGGYVERKRDEIDRRRVLLHATAEGYKLAYNAPSPLQGKLKQRLNELPELERATIGFSLQRVVELMEARDIDASPMLTTGEMQDDAQRIETDDSTN